MSSADSDQTNGFGRPAGFVVEQGDGRVLADGKALRQTRHHQFRFHRAQIDDLTGGRLLFGS